MTENTSTTDTLTTRATGKPQPGDEVRMMQDIHGTALAWMTITRVTTVPDVSYPEPDYPHVVSLQYAHVLANGDTCCHEAITRINDQYRDRAAWITQHRTA